MKALVYRQFGQADELEWVDDWPDPEVSATGVLIRSAAGSINPKDVLLRKGKFSKTFARDPLPRVAGLDVAGSIIAVGSQVSGFLVGQKVFGMTNNFAGGVHAQIAKLDQTEIFEAPSNLSMEQAACVPLAALTALQALRDCCQIKKGDTVLINGASGGVGHFALQIAKVLGAEVHAVCGPGNLSFVESLGCDAAYSYSDQPATQIDHSFDGVFDVFGRFSRSSFSRQLGHSGIYVSTVPKAATIWGEALYRMGLFKTSRMVQVQSRSEDLRQIKQWIEHGQLKPHLEKSYPVSQAADAHRHVESKRTVGKVCIVF